MALFWKSLVCFATVASSMAIFIGGEQDVGSPLRVAQCRATCLERYSNDGPNGESMCLQGPDCFMCWEYCELLQSNYQKWGFMCDEKEICFPGCQESCRFHAETSSQAQQASPVIHTKGEEVIQVRGALAKWPRPSILEPDTPLVYVVMVKSAGGVWHQIIQTLDLTTRVPIAASNTNSTLRVLVVNPQGLVTIYSPDETLSDQKRGQKENTEIKATTSRAFTENAPWSLKEISLIHQKVLVIGEIAWEPRAAFRGVYLVTWEVDGGGLKGNLFTDSTSVTLSLWPDTIYHIQVELVSRIVGVENLKSEMLDLDTGRALKVSTEGRDGELIGGKKVDFNSPMMSVLVNAVRGEHTRHARLHNIELISGVSAAAVLFVLVLLVGALWRYKQCRRSGMALDNIITGTSTVRSHKLIEDCSTTAEFHPPIITVMKTATAAPEVTFKGENGSSVTSSGLKQEVQV